MFDYYEARQHINLSSIAYEIIESDKYEFLDKPSRQRIINMILSSYMDDAEAAIDNATHRYQEELYSQLATIPDTPTKADIFRTLVDSYRNKLVTRATSYPKEHAFKFQLDKQNYASMQEWRDDNGYYDGIPGKFFKAVIEEYSRKSFFDREQILLRDVLDEVNDCIETHQLIILTVNGRKLNRYEVRPYCICHDPEYNYHYLVGMSRKAGTKYDERPVSFRLSRINRIKRSHARSGKITVEQKKIIDDKLKSGGVQFLLGETEIIQIKLTTQGKKCMTLLLICAHHLMSAFAMVIVGF